MATTADYLNKLVTQKNTLADNLVTKGVTATHDETLETLVPKVLNISGGTSGGNGIYPIGENGRPTGDVVVPSGVTTLDKYVFAYNSNVTSITFSEGLVSTGTEACYSDSKLESVSLPSTFQTFGQKTFESCSNLTTVNIPNEVTELVIGSRCFWDCSNLSNESANKLISKSSTIQDYGFCGCKNIKSIEIVATKFGNYCFQNCSSLTNVKLVNTDNYGNFGSGMFSNCIALETVIMPHSYTTISDYMFKNTKIGTFTIPNTLTQIGLSAFEQCSSLSTITIADEATFSIKNYGFDECSALTNNVVQNIISHASTLGYNIFSYCLGLTHLSIKFAGESMFQHCTNLVSVEISEPYKDKIQNSIFAGCTSLENCILPNNATAIGIDVFYNCTALKTVYLPSSITSATNNSLSHSSSHYIFKNCTALEDVQLGQDWNMSLSVNSSENLTVDSMVAMFNSLKDLTGETAKTLTLGSTNLAKLTDEQKAIATNKNWTLA